MYLTRQKPKPGKQRHKNRQLHFLYRFKNKQTIHSERSNPRQKQTKTKQTIQNNLTKNIEKAPWSRPAHTNTKWKQKWSIKKAKHKHVKWLQKPFINNNKIVTAACEMVIKFIALTLT